MTRRRKRRGKMSGKKLAAAVSTLLVTAVALLFYPVASWLGYDMKDILAMVWQPSVTVSHPSEGTAEVHFIDVGQANSILIKGSEKTVLIDGGESENAPKIIGYLEQNGVEKIDYFFNTHPHSDHVGGCRKIMEAVPTTEFVMTKLSEKNIPTTATYQKLIKWLTENKDRTAAHEAQTGDSYELGGGLHLEVIGPVKLYDDLNNTSLVMRMDFGETSFLFTGDMEAKAERDLLEHGGISKVTVLSAPHHGSDTSIDDAFMRAVDAEASVISCGVDNDYGHPSPKTLKIYSELGIDCYRTDRQGDIKIITDGSKLTYVTERGE